LTETALLSATVVLGSSYGKEITQTSSATLNCYNLIVIVYSMTFFALHFCLGTGVPRHSAGGVGTYVVRIIHNEHARVMEAENSATLTIYRSEYIFIALGWRSEMIKGFNEYS